MYLDAGYPNIDIEYFPFLSKQSLDN